MQNFISRKFGALSLFTVVLATISSCVDPVSEEIQKNRHVNEWIQQHMNVYYLWNDRMPSKPNKNLNPSHYFDALLYKTEDRFSYIAEDYTELTDALGGIQMEAGYDFTLGSIEGSPGLVVGIINYIKPNSPASETVLKRGDIFLTINGTQLTEENYYHLLNQISAPHVLGIDEGNTIKSVSLNVIRYEENPVLLDTIYAMDNKKIAYLVFNFFASDKGDKSYTYSKELNAIFGKYKQENIDELILDLRYNGGGSVEVTIALAGMISNRTSTDLFCIDQYNSILDRELKSEYGNDYNKTFFSDFLITNYDENGRIISQNTPIHKLIGLNRLYVLTSNQTASASELIINGLKPYMDVILIGKTTYGKNVGMYLLYEKNTVKQRANRWGMLPIVTKIFNANNQSDYTHGFTPTIQANEHNALPWLPLGNTREFLLEKALDHIGVQPLNNLRSSEKEFYLHPSISSFERMPVRKNLIIPKIR